MLGSRVMLTTSRVELTLTLVKLLFPMMSTRVGLKRDVYLRLAGINLSTEPGAKTRSVNTLTTTLSSDLSSNASNVTYYSS